MNVDCRMWSQNALKCDVSDGQYVAYMDMSSHESSWLGDTSPVWICCGMRNMNAYLLCADAPSHDDNSNIHTTFNT